ncbi:hypothetical protein BG004_003468 [Podila humilis]|nr:hypothetical protein BG004_003468 [Podila humilis]
MDHRHPDDGSHYSEILLPSSSSTDATLHHHHHPSLVHVPQEHDHRIQELDPLSIPVAHGFNHSHRVVVPIHSSSSSSSITEYPSTAVATFNESSSASSSSYTSSSTSGFGSIFSSSFPTNNNSSKKGKKQHKRRPSSVPGWDSDDDQELEKANNNNNNKNNNNNNFSTNQQQQQEEQQQQPVVVPEKSIWLQKETRKRKKVQTCLCLGVILCFLVLGAILAFTYKEQIFSKENNYNSNNNKSEMDKKGGAAAGETYTRQQLNEAIESMYQVNATIIKDPKLVKVFYGMDYTPRGSQEPDCRANLGHVIEDIKVLSQLTDRIRLYGMACHQAEYVLKAIEYLGLDDMQVILTLWVDNNKASWEKQARIFWNIIDNHILVETTTTSTSASNSNNKGNNNVQVTSRISGVSVGNEVLFRNEDTSRKQDHVPVATLTHYIDEIRRGLSERASDITTTTATSSASSNDPSMLLKSRRQMLGQIPIFSSDLGRNAHQIVDKVDWVLSNIHPFFAYTPVDQAADWALSNFKTETLKAAHGKPAMISEVGWPSGPNSATLGSAVPSMDNLQTFVDTWVCNANAENIPYYFFEAFDEPWKNSINAREAQWGIMTVDRQLKIRVPTC